MKTKLKTLALVVISFSLMGNSSKSFQEIERETIEVIDIYPPETYKYNEYQLIEILAKRLNVSSEDLFQLIHFETAGTLNPKAQNPNSSAKGMIQFTDATASTIKDENGNKYKNSQDLIDRCSTATCQLEIPNSRNRFGGPVYQYLSRFGKFETKTELFMAVFYPDAIGKNNFKFSSKIAKVNGGISSANEYVKLAEDRMPKGVYFSD